MPGHRLPARAAVARFIQAAARAVGWRIDAPRRPPRLPQGCEDRPRVASECQRDRAGVGIPVQHLPPAPAPVRALEHTALGIRRVAVSERRDVDDVRVLRVHQHRADLERVLEPDVRPGLAGIRGLVHAVTGAEAGADVGFARTHVNHVRVGRRHRDRADRGHRLLVEDRIPGAPRVPRFPDPAVYRPEIEMVRLPGHPGHCRHAASAKRTDQPPAES